MKTITFSSTEKKINLLMQVAKEMGVKTKEYELTDEEMGLPGPKVSNAQLETWLLKDDGGEGYTSTQMKDFLKKELSNKRRK
jgi:hypothetical protein